MANVEKISIALPSEMIGRIKEAVEGGTYASTSEVIREALRDWTDKQQRKAIAVKELKRLWRQGLDSGPGRFGSMDEIKAEARHRFETRKQPA
ncbi:MAG: type II toxin-antitoxin system ParD family antitoxin [Aestuariivirga sp.]